jgi:dethiobiotin synthetase/malonyl-CoA O-methyltransferase
VNIFVTGTDTAVGKTVVSAWICHQSGASYWKPIQTGSGSDSDRKTVGQLSEKIPTIGEVYKLRAPLSPYDAANREKISLNIDELRKNIPQKTVIEGAGGIAVPIAENFRMIDLAAEMNAKVLVVAKSKLGFLNHIFLTVEVLKNRAIPIVGIVINGETDDSLLQTIRRFSGEKILKILPYAKNIQKMIGEESIPREIGEILSP